jgi:16S rRNA (cytosine967-C5)-methyltransferase
MPIILFYNKENALNQAINPRKYAIKILSSFLQKKSSFAVLLSDHSIPLKIFPMVKQLCFGVARHCFELEAIVNGLLATPLKTKEYDILCVLYLGVYQLLYMDIPDYAAVSETIAAIPKKKQGWAKGLVNGCLRRFLREKKEHIASLQQNLEARVNHPLWFIERLKSAWPCEWESILHENNQRAPMVLRINSQKTSRNKYLDVLKKAGIEGREVPALPCAIVLDQPCAVSELPDFENGFVSVQDAASQYVADLFRLAPGQSFLEACAAPGGKTSLLLEREPLLHLTAIEKSPERLLMLQENLKRLSLSTEVLCGDAMTQDWWTGKLFDCVLMDVPCSATGVIRRHPDIKWLRRESDMQELCETQIKILENLWQMLKPGGILGYTSCSVLPEENDEIIANFLASHQEAKMNSLQLPVGRATQYGWQLLPNRHNDGFFYASIQKG